MKQIHMITTDNGDGSNDTLWVTDDAVVDRALELVDEGNETFASGDGLQVKTLYFPDDFDLEDWIKVNHISITTIEGIEKYDY